MNGLVQIIIGVVILWIVILIFCALTITWFHIKDYLEERKKNGGKK
jgi:hypothetical protein